jgi:hypothetical protein
MPGSTPTVSKGINITCDVKSGAELRAAPQPAGPKRYMEDKYLPSGYASHGWTVAFSETDGTAKIKKHQATTKRPG